MLSVMLPPVMMNVVPLFMYTPPPLDSVMLSVMLPPFMVNVPVSMYTPPPLALEPALLPVMQPFQSVSAPQL